MCVIQRMRPVYPIAVEHMYVISFARRLKCLAPADYDVWAVVSYIG